MKWREIAITTRQENADAMAEIFETVGAMGMVIEDPQLIASYIESNVWDLHDVEIPDVPEGMIRVKTYLAIDDMLEDRLAALQEELSARERSEEWPAHAWTMTDLHEDDWAHAWKAFFKPEKVGRRVVIRPTWEAYVASDDDLVISIDPGMAFGTGTHPTTVMCIRALEDYVHSEARVLDVGTGSGVLSIAAALLGAKKVLAVDNDPVAVATAQENAALNQVDGIVEVRRNDLLAGLEEQADILVANIIADVIIRLAPQAGAVLAPEGIMIASGIIQNRLDDVVEAMTENGFTIEELISHGEWAALVARKAGGSTEA
ncbi:50S ribosomal protein L11 methyltransferase [Heliobacterium gestii]|uniref:Ribosomal protein L11 methyltransferase n=1 Tax=Heliomicrobium gestii TaxID=2699 RepID=A0A845LFC9_HELGE|nr:50S ribosomal protein L11 methyltransferase [Heliomicrobium gestii]MBM7868005.1 ribosomal protein L11 methyltransferase [Heliomicrobium gestii]MZP44271.1 50S ribosomal protein L11 methyltransferase [Heliomicrobium gestii]